MDEDEISGIINNYIKEICHYSQMQVFATSSYQKKYFQRQIDEASGELVNLYLVHQYNLNKQTVQTSEQQETPAQPSIQPAPDQSQTERVFTLVELAGYDGSDGSPAYVAVNNIVYDVSNVINWAGGTHFGLFAGRNLSAEFMGCHRGMLEILEKLQKIGVLKQE